MKFAAQAALPSLHHALARDGEGKALLLISRAVPP